MMTFNGSRTTIRRGTVVSRYWRMACSNLATWTLVVFFVTPSSLTKEEDGAGGNTAAAEGDEGVQAGIVPVTDVALLDKLDNLALGEDCAGNVQTAIFALVGTVDLQLIAEPIVRDARKLEFSRAERVRDLLNAITQTVGKVVGGVDLPLATSAVVLLLLAVHDTPGK